MRIADCTPLKKESIRPHFGVLYLVLLLALLTACTPSPSIQPTPSPNTYCLPSSSQAVMLTMYYGSEKKAWIDDVVRDFKRHQTTCHQPIIVNAVPMGSGESMQKIIDGAQPDIWSPAGSVWLALINQMWRDKQMKQTQPDCPNPDCDLIATGATDTPSLVLSPVVIAMWKPEAEALHWPEKQLGWADFASLSTNPTGNFKFGHTYPDSSNSGLDALFAEYYAAVGKIRGLSLSDVNSSKAQSSVGNVESSITHFDESTEFLADKMFKNGPNYLNAAVTYESLVVQANDPKLYPRLAFPVVAIYPKEGTFYSDHPFAILQARWVTVEKKAAALKFRNFLLAADQQKKALEYGFRPVISSVRIAAPIDNTHGVDPQQPYTTLPIPDMDVVNSIRASWHHMHRVVDMLLLLDCSESMHDQLDGTSRIEAAERNITVLVSLLSASDNVGLTAFSDKPVVITPMSPLGSNKQEILNKVVEISPGGPTRLYNTIAEQVQMLQALPPKHTKIIVVFTSGQDTASQLSLAQLISQITARKGSTGGGVTVFTVAYSNNPDAVSGLLQIANATGGHEYPGTTKNMQQVYISISKPLGASS